MSKYVRQVELVQQFDGEQVKVVLKPLRREHLFELQALLPKPDKDGKVLVTDASAGKAFERYGQLLLSDYLVSDDLKDAAGTPVPKEEWVPASYFSQLVANLMLDHMQRSMPGNP